MSPIPALYPRQTSKRMQLFEPGKLIGEGAFARVFESKCGKVALKYISSTVSQERYAEEIKIMRFVTDRIRNDSFLAFIGTLDFLVDDRVLVVELLSGGTLFNRIVNGKKKFTEKIAKRIFGELILALSELHAHDCIHLDLKPENLVYQSEAVESSLKILDFGNAIILNKKVEEWPLICSNEEVLRGTLSYSAPETLGGEVQNSRLYSPSADVWGLGCVLYCTLIGYMPFYAPNKTSQNIMVEKIMKGKYEPMTGSAWQSISKAGKSMIQKMLVVKRTDRPTCIELLSDPWLMSDAPAIKVIKVSVDATAAIPHPILSSHPSTPKTPMSLDESLLQRPKVYQESDSPCVDLSSIIQSHLGHADVEHGVELSNSAYLARLRWIWLLPGIKRRLMKRVFILRQQRAILDAFHSVSASSSSLSNDSISTPLATAVPLPSPSLVPSDSPSPLLLKIQRSPISPPHHPHLEENDLAEFARTLRVHFSANKISATGLTETEFLSLGEEPKRVIPLG